MNRVGNGTDDILSDEHFENSKTRRSAYLLLVELFIWTFWIPSRDTVPLKISPSVPPVNLLASPLELHVLLGPRDTAQAVQQAVLRHLFYTANIFFLISYYCCLAIFCFPCPFLTNLSTYLLYTKNHCVPVLENAVSRYYSWQSFWHFYN